MRVIEPPQPPYLSKALGAISTGDKDLVELDGVSSNQLLETLEDWSRQLEALEGPVGPEP